MTSIETRPDAFSSACVMSLKSFFSSLRLYPCWFLHPLLHWICKNESCRCASTQLNIYIYFLLLCKAFISNLENHIWAISVFRISIFAAMLWIPGRHCSALLSPLCSCVVFVAISRNSCIASQNGHSCLRMLCCQVVLGSVHSSSHLFVLVSQTQYLWNTLRKCLSFPFMTVFPTEEWSGFDRPKVKSQSDWLCRCRWGA